MALLLIVKAIVLPSEPVQFKPALKVDLVGLPDVLKKDLVKVKPAPEPKAAPPKEEAAPKPKPVPDKNVMALKRKKAKRKKKLKSALDRIKALERIKSQVKAEGQVLKGNKISRGSSVSEDAVESQEVSYVDSLREHIRRTWALPRWLADQGYEAQVLVHMDRRGYLTSLKFTKGSGNPQYDEAVKQALVDSQPLPVPPDALGSLRIDGIILGFPL